MNFVTESLGGGEGISDECRTWLEVGPARGSRGKDDGGEEGTEMQEFDGEGGWKWMRDGRRWPKRGGSWGG